MGEDISEKIGGEQEFLSRRNNYPLSPEEFSLKIRNLVEFNYIDGIMDAYKKLFAVFVNPQNP